MVGGWFKVWRGIFSGWLIKDHNCLVFFLWCISRAAYEEKKIIQTDSGPVELVRGEFIFGRKSAAEQIYLSEKQVRRCLDKLVKAGYLVAKRANERANKRANAFTIISVVNYSTYQLLDTKEGPIEGPMDGPQIRSKEVKEKNLNHVEMSMKIPLADGTWFEPTDEDMGVWVFAYPNIDVESELKKLMAWNYSSPKNRKKRSGVKRHINSWLSRAAEKAKPAEKSFSWRDLPGETL